MRVAHDPGARTGGPRFLNLLQIRFPATAVASIAHRVTGFLLILATPLLVYLLDLAVTRPAELDALLERIGSSPARVLLAVPIAALAYHLAAGLRVLALDLGLGEARETARRSALGALAAGALGLLVAGAVLL
jgi:succinate dehydrogenase / fumarate reductase cytochrome b subunit